MRTEMTRIWLTQLSGRTIKPTQMVVAQPAPSSNPQDILGALARHPVKIETEFVLDSATELFKQHIPTTNHALYISLEDQELYGFS